MADSIAKENHSVLDDELSKTFSPTLKKQLHIETSKEVKEIT